MASAAPWEALSADMAEHLRPQLPVLADELIATIAEQVPQYARPMEGTFGRGVRTGVEVALGRFLELFGTRLPALTEQARSVYVELGRGELRQGRSLEALLAAYRIGARLSYRRFAADASTAGLPAEGLVALAEAIFAYIEELSAASVEGYATEQSLQAGERDRRRREVLALLVAGTADPTAAVEAAATAGWTLPDRVMAVVVPAARAVGLATRLGPDALVVPTGDEVVALVPPPLDRRGWTRLTAALRGAGAVVGPPRPFAATAATLRLAEQAARLLAAGVVDADPLYVEQHLATLIVHRDRELVDEIAARRLRPLDALRSSSRDRFAETLLAWLQHRGERQRIADALHVHPQTVGYRLTRLRELFGPDLDDPTARFELEVALRAQLPWQT